MMMQQTLMAPNRKKLTYNVRQILRQETYNQDSNKSDLCLVMYTENGYVLHNYIGFFIIIIIIIIMSLRGWSCFLFLDPQNEVGPSISSSVVLCSFILLVYTVMLVLVFYLCPSSVRVVATFSGIVLFPLLYSVLPFFP